MRNFFKIIILVINFFRNFNIGKHSVHFERVKRLRWERENSKSIEKLTFSQLESLKIHRYFHQEIDIWSEFFRQNNHLNRLHIHLWYIGDSELVEITGKLNLTKLTILQWHEPINIHVIGQLINAQKNLTSFHYWTDKNIQKEVNILRERYEIQWTVKNTTLSYWYGVSMEKLNANSS